MSQLPQEIVELTQLIGQLILLKGGLTSPVKVDRKSQDGERQAVLLIPVGIGQLELVDPFVDFLDDLADFGFVTCIYFERIRPVCDQDRQLFGILFSHILRIL